MGESAGVEGVDMAGGGESGGIVRCCLIWDITRWLSFERRVSRDLFPTLTHSRGNSGVARSFKMRR